MNIVKLDNTDLSKEEKKKFEEAFNLLLKVFKVKIEEPSHLESKFCKQFFKILIIEKDNENAYYYSKLLANMGFVDITVATSSRGAVELLKTTEFNIIISDYENNSVDLFLEYDKMKKGGVFMIVSGTDLNVEDMSKIGILYIKKSEWITSYKDIVKNIYLKTLEHYLQGR